MLRTTMAPLQEGRREGTAAPGFLRRASLGPEEGTRNVLYEEANLGALPCRRAEEKVARGRELRFATLNIRSLCRPTVHHQIAHYMRSRRIDLLALQETRLASTTQYVVDDYLFVLSGHGGPEREFAGVGFVLSRDVRRCVTALKLAMTDVSWAWAWILPRGR